MASGKGAASGGGRKPNGYWKAEQNRVEAVKKMVEDSGKRPEDITAKDFTDYGLSTVLKHTGDSPYLALREAGYEIFPWLMKQVPKRFWDSPRNREWALRWLLDLTGKRPHEINAKDFRDHGLYRLLLLGNGSISRLFKEAGESIPKWWWDRGRPGCWDTKKNRVAAIRWLLRVTGKKPRQIKVDDFGDHGLSGMLSHYNSSPFEALREVGYKLKPWELKQTPMRFWHTRENRVRATRWLVEKSRKDPRDISREDFYKWGVVGLLDILGNSPYKALVEAGYDLEPWEMSNVPYRYWEKKKNRVAAVRRLVEESGLGPTELDISDFRSHGLHGLMAHYGGSPFKALEEAGFKVLPWERKQVPRHFWTEKKNRVAAIEWLAEQVGKPAIYITADDFRENGLGGLLAKYKGGGYAGADMQWLFKRHREPAMRALLEAGLVR